MNCTFKTLNIHTREHFRLFSNIFSCLFQAQGFVEHFTDKCGGVISWVNQITQSIAFAEGWGLYAELLIAEDTNSYEDRLWQKYGALKWRVG